MTDVTDPNAADQTPVQANGADAQPGGPSLRVIAQFIRDLSFENPRAPESLRMDQGPQPQAEIGLELNVRGRPDGMFEVDLKLNVAAKKDGQTNFAVELLYGGLFQIEGASEQDLEPILFIECPRVLFPFARRIVADCVTDGGFPPFPLDPIDFAGLYMSQRGGIQNNAADQPPVGNA